ncbi:MAG TPA: uroporphyrinogen decarboxylase family protein [Armatimonadota bacterium]
MNSRERFHALMQFQPVDRLPLVEWAIWWDKTQQRWHDEGLPSAVAARDDLYRYFGLEVYHQEWLEPRVPSPPYHGGPVVRSMDEYLRLRETLFAPAQLDAARWQALARQQAGGDVVLWCSIVGFFWFPRLLLGIEGHLLAFYDQPELIQLMNADICAWNLQLLERITDFCTPDFVTIAEDMSYNLGPMLSKTLFDEFLAPYYHQLIPALKARGIYTLLDSDGDVSELAYWCEEVGIDGILPLERQAGVDIARLRAEHPSLRFIGHYDKMVMDKGEAAMRAEFERVLPVARQGGYIISVDHQTHPGVSLQDYQLYLKLFREYAALV